MVYKLRSRKKREKRTKINQTPLNAEQTALHAESREGRNGVRLTSLTDTRQTDRKLD